MSMRRRTKSRQPEFWVTTADYPNGWRTRRRVDLEMHRAVFDWALKLVAEHGLLKGKTLDKDTTIMGADAAMRSIVCNAGNESAFDGFPHR